MHFGEKLSRSVIFAASGAKQTQLDHLAAPLSICDTQICFPITNSDYAKRKKLLNIIFSVL